jgi:hypothetical protein
MLGRVAVPDEYAVFTFHFSFEIGGPPRNCTWWPCASTSVRLRAGASLSKFAAQTRTRRRSRTAAVRPVRSWPSPEFASREMESQAHRSWRPAITSTVRGLCRRASFTWERWSRCWHTATKGIAPCIPVWRVLADGHQRVSLNTYARKIGVPCGSRTHVRGFADHCLGCSANGTEREGRERKFSVPPAFVAPPPWRP